MAFHQITRKFEFDSAHRVLNHESKCAHLHGHRYVAEVTVSAPALDKLGRVVDFSVLKTIIGGWIDANWDHNIILNAADPLFAAWMNPDIVRENETTVRDIFAGKSPFFLLSNPTAEQMATCLFATCESLLLTEVFKVIHVRLYETPNCWADVYSVK
jgi:6-pyruvoyltetrahydropterin/6-carboxytetrahydropterin synthase